VQVGGAGAALALAEVDGDADAAVAGGLDRFHRAQAHIDVQPAVFAAADLGLAGAQLARARQQPLGDAGQALQAFQAVVAAQFGSDRVQCFILVVRVPSQEPGHPWPDLELCDSFATARPSMAGLGIVRFLRKSPAIHGRTF
jgi:hypothetical protein